LFPYVPNGTLDVKGFMTAVIILLPPDPPHEPPARPLSKYQLPPPPPFALNISVLFEFII